jgi:hypothetical protein
MVDQIWLAVAIASVSPFTGLAAEIKTTFKVIRCRRMTISGLHSRTLYHAGENRGN